VNNVVNSIAQTNKKRGANALPEKRTQNLVRFARFLNLYRWSLRSVVPARPHNTLGKTGLLVDVTHQAVSTKVQFMNHYHRCEDKMTDSKHRSTTPSQPHRRIDDTGHHLRRSDPPAPPSVPQGTTGAEGDQAKHNVANSVPQHIIPAHANCEPLNLAWSSKLRQEDDVASLPLLLDASEVAWLLRTTRESVYAMARRGQLPGVTRIGRLLRFRSRDLLRWLDERRAPSPKETRR